MGLDPTGPLSAIGWLQTVWTAITAVGRRWDMAKWEVTLHQQQRVLDAEKTRMATLLAKDKEFREAPDRGLRASVIPVGFATWTDHDEITIPIQILVANAWIYPARLRKLSGIVRVGRTEIEIGYIQEHEILPIPAGGHVIPRMVTWRPSVEERQALGINREQARSLAVSVEGTAYLTSEGTEVSLPFHGQTTIVIPVAPVSS